MTKQISTLNNGIEYIYRQNPDTPRMALCLNISINKPEIKPGVYTLVSRLLLQGTKNYTSEELANEFEKYAIDFSSELFTNYLRLRFVCLNEDFPKAIELMNEVITNSDFEEFSKERLKMKCEIPAELDSPRAAALDAYGRTIFENHYYGNSLTRILESVDDITRDDVTKAYNYIIKNGKMSLAVVGALSSDDVVPLIEKTIGALETANDSSLYLDTPVLNKAKTVETLRSDLNQAHIVKGWLVPAYDDDCYYPLLLLNVILGASGLSSRLFAELRDKRGLAYVVRSTYETFKLTGNFMIYIATEPKNIEVSLKGFDEEIEKIRTIPVSVNELEDAKNNLIGKCAFLDETNLQQACRYAKHGVLGLGFEFNETVKEKIKNVTSDEILKCAAKYFNDKFVLSIIKP